MNLTPASFFAAGEAAGDDQQKAAPLGLFVLLLLGVACYFLFKSMSRHLKRVRDEFPAGPTARTAMTGGSGAAARPGTPSRPAGDAARTTNPEPGGAEGSYDSGPLPPR